MTIHSPIFSAQLAAGSDDILAAQRLRYKVFAAELGSDGASVDHDSRLESDRFDPHADHLLLRDKSRAPDDQVVGVYRLLTATGATTAGQYYSEDEYDLTVLHESGRQLLELGRSCLHPDYRGGPAMLHLWSALGDYVADRRIDLIFGVASFHGTDVGSLRQPLSLLHHRHLAPPDIRVTARTPGAQNMNLMPEDIIDRRQALLDTPALIKAYLRLGGVVGEGAFVDRDFNTTDVCLLMPTNKMKSLQKAIYGRGQGLG